MLQEHGKKDQFDPGEHSEGLDFGGIATPTTLGQS
jgi:hypothetical protein